MVRYRVSDVVRWFEIVDGVEKARLDVHGVRMDVVGHAHVVGVDDADEAMGRLVVERNAKMVEERIPTKTPARYASSKATTSLELELPAPSMPSQDVEHSTPAVVVSACPTAADAS